MKYKYKKSKIGRNEGKGEPPLIMNLIMRKAFKKYRKRNIKGLK